MSETHNYSKSILTRRNQVRNLVTSRNNTRITLEANTGVLVNNQTANVLIPSAPKSYSVVSAYANNSSWIRVYTSQLKRDADIGRSITSDPDANAGVVIEVITANVESVVVSPTVSGTINDANVQGAFLPMKVTNRSGANASINVKLTVLVLED